MKYLYRPDNLLSFPFRYTNDQAAAFPIVTQTAYTALIEKAKIKKNEYILISGATGGVGHAAIQLAKSKGSIVIAIVSKDAKKEFVLSNGADYAIKYDPFIKNRIMKITKNKGVDVVYDTIGGKYLTKFMSCSAFGARILVIGFVSKKFTKITSNYILIKGLNIIGIRAGEYLKRNPNSKKRIVRNINNIAKNRFIVPSIFASINFIDAKIGLKLLKDRKVLGKIVLKINNN